MNQGPSNEPIGETPPEEIEPKSLSALETKKNKPSVWAVIKSWQFLAGFLGWHLINGVVWFQVNGGRIGYLEDSYLANIVFFPFNLLALIVFPLIKQTRKFGLGLLAAVALNLLLSLVLSVGMNGICFIPFYFK